MTWVGCGNDVGGSGNDVDGRRNVTLVGSGGLACEYTSLDVGGWIPAYAGMTLVGSGGLACEYTSLDVGCRFPPTRE